MVRIKNEDAKIKIPTTMVIFGATGDLSQRKLLPALLDLYIKGMLPDPFRVVGFSRGAYTNEAFRTFIRKAIEKKAHGHSRAKIKTFLANACYQQGLFEDQPSYKELAELLEKLDEDFHICSNKLFYLAVPPSLYETIFEHLASSGLTIPCGPGEGWTRVLVEKPFGKDLDTATRLDNLLGKLFQEEQIFRIDHYLAKEAMQNILSFRFSNVLFEPIWSNQYIERVAITLHETLGMEGRGAFYDEVGALRDVGQNHILQMLSFIAMESPQILEAQAVRKERARILQSLKPIGGKDVANVTTRAQYKGFRKEEAVSPSSTTETYFRLEAHVQNERWKGVPFILESGKKMKETKTEITVFFKKTEACLCPPEAEKHHQNILTFRIQPDEGISILFWAKKPGFSMELEPRHFSFSYHDSENTKRLPDAYERILYDCIKGDQILFTSTEEVAASWKFITPILKHWGKTKLYEYTPGSDGLKNEKEKISF